MTRLIDFLVENRLVALLLAGLLTLAGLYVVPFPIDTDLPRDPVPVDAIPDIGENQQIVFTRWPGRSPRDVEDQVTYPLTVALLGLPGVKGVRARSAFGFSSVYVIFQDDVDFYWSRTRLLEKLSALPPDTLPDDVRPELGPDATGLGQVFWYTLEAEGFDRQELREIQDFYVRYALQSVEGVAEVAGVGGQVIGWQVEVDPDLLQHYGLSLAQVFNAVRQANQDVGAGSLEINKVEYVIRGVGLIRSPEDLADVVIVAPDHVPVTVGQVARVVAGPEPRRGALDKGGVEAVGGVVTVRYGENPLAVIERVHDRIAEIAPSLPRRTLADGRVSQVQIVPFYDRTDLIHETLETLSTSLVDEILITIVVVVVLVWELRISFMISGLLPLAVLLAFLGMRVTGVDANLMSLAGIAIAIGTMVDMGIIVAENIARRLQEAPDEPVNRVVRQAASEVAGAVTTAVATTIVSFLPVFTMSGAEAKLFRPLAFTKTYALIASIAVALFLLPPLAAAIFQRARRGPLWWRHLPDAGLAAAGVAALVVGWGWAGLALFVLAGWRVLRTWLSEAGRRRASVVINVLAVAAVLVALGDHWAPLGPGAGFAGNLLAVLVTCGGLLGGVLLFLRWYEPMLRWCLSHRWQFLLLPALLLVTGISAWRGASVFLPAALEQTGVGQRLMAIFPGMKNEFMPPLDEGSFLWMPSTMPHASLGESLDALQLQDRAIAAIPEVKTVVGKIGRVDSALDPAPVSMVETIIFHHPEYGPPDPETGERKRLWRDEIKSPDDIWKAISAAGTIPGSTAAPRLQPIAARIVMLQSGVRAPMAVKVRGQDLADIEAAGRAIEAVLKTVDGVRAEAVQADRIVGKPYLEIHVDRDAIARHGLQLTAVQHTIQTAVGGSIATTLIDGRVRRPVRVRYPRERRDDLEALRRVRVATPAGAHVPLDQLATIDFVRGPMVIKSEDTFLIGDVLFDKLDGYAEVDVVERAQAALEAAQRAGTLAVPPGVSWAFAGTFENQVRAQRGLLVILPVSLALIFLILYLQFRKVSTSLLVFSGIAVAWAGGFVFLWLYSGPGLPDWTVAGRTLDEVFNVQTYHLSVAVWVGFIALFGIATDDGVVISTYLEQQAAEAQPQTVEALREATVAACLRRIRPCLMTTATTLLALLPVITSQGRGADVMVPMALPGFGGMVFELMTLFVVPVGWCAVEELKLRVRQRVAAG